MKKIIEKVLIFALILSLLLGLSVSAFAVTEVASGYCGGEGDGTNLSWTLDSDGVLTISGSGEMKNYIFQSLSSLAPELASMVAPWVSYKDSIKAVIIESGVTSIGTNTFTDYQALEHVTVPDSVITMSSGAFSGCSGLADADGFVIVKGTLFDYFGSQTHVEIPDSVSVIGSTAFHTANADIVSVSIPVSVQTIECTAFWGMSALSDVYYEGSAQQCINMFVDWDGNEALDKTAKHFAAGEGSMVSGYCGGEGEGTNLTWTMDLNTGALTISGSGKMAEYTSVNTMTTTAPWSGRITRVKTAVINQGVTSIGAYTFTQCEELSSFAIPDSVMSISSSAFNGCTGFCSFVIPDSVTSIGSGAFVNCTGLRNLVISNSLNDIGLAAFASCIGLTDVTIPDGITSIGEYMFFNCINLTSVTIPDTVTSIGGSAFFYCDNLKTVYYAGTEEQWKAIQIGDGNANLTDAELICNSGEIGKFSAKLLFENESDQMTVRAGETFTVNLVADRNDGLVDFQCALQYDTSALKLVSVQDAGKLGTLTSNSNLAAHPYKMAWHDALSEGSTYTGNVVTLTFMAAPDAVEKDYSITLNGLKAYDTKNRALLCSVEAATATVVPFLYGDVDNDGEITVDDATYLLKYLVDEEGFRTLTFPKSADVDGHRGIDVNDVVAVLRHIANWGQYQTLPLASQSDGPVDPTLVKTYTAPTTYGEIVSDLGYTSAADKVTFTVVEDGLTVGTAQYDNTSTATIGSQNVLIEVYKTGTNTYDIIVVNTYVPDPTEKEPVGAAYKEAVGVMIGTGIVNAASADEINATAALTREQAARIITYMLVGPKMAETLKADEAPFKDVAADRWSAGYIAYCAKAEIISGDGDGYFGPTVEVSGMEFARMLLYALGFGKDGEYEGTGWTTCVTQDAFNAGLFQGDETAAASDPLQFQQALLMAFNGLNFSKSAATSVYVVTKGGNVLYSGTDSMTALVMQQGNPGSELRQVAVSAGSLGAINYGLTKTVKTDEFGRTSTAWTNGKSGKAEVIYSMIPAEPVKTYTTATTFGKIVSDLGFTKVADKVNFTVIEDGVAGAPAQYDKTSTAAIGGQGVLVEVYKTAANAYDVVVVNTYVATLAKGDITAAKKATATTDAVPAYITIDGMVYVTDAFKAGDVVLYTVADGEIASVEKAQSVVGKVTATAAGYFRVDGEKMFLAACNAAVIGTDAGYKIDAVNEFTYFLDNYGNVVLAKVGVVVPVAKNYTYVIEWQAVKGTIAGADLINAATDKPAVAKAKVIDLTTGEIKVVDMAITKNAAGTMYVYADEQGKATTDEVITASGKPEAIYEYVTLADGSYVFGAEAAGESVTLTKGSATGVTGKVMTSSTVVNVVEYTKTAAGYTGATVTTTTGIANFPVDPTTYTGAIVAFNPQTGVVTSITVVKAKAAPVAATRYAIYNGVGETDAQGTKYGFYVDGELVEFYATADLSGLVKGDVVSYTLTNGKISAAEKTAPIASAQAVSLVDTTFVVAGGNVYYFAKTGVKVFDAVTKAAVEIAAGATVTLYGRDENNVEFVVVTNASTESPKYAIYNGVGETDAQGTRYNFYVDGEPASFYSTVPMSLTKGDVVSYELTNGRISAIEKKTALATAQTVSAFNSTSVTAGGTTYYFAKTGFKAFDAATKVGVDLAVGATITVYGTDANNVDFLVVSGAAVPAAKTYTYVIEVAAKAAAFSAETPSVAQPAVAKANVIDLVTGEIKVVDIAVVTGTGANSGKYFYADAQGKATAAEVVTDTGKPEAIYEYVTLADGSYVFGAEAAGESVTLTKGSATGVAGKVMTSSTVVNVVEYTKDAAGAYTDAAVTTTIGIANFPAAPTTYNGAIVTANPKTGVVTSITVVKAKSAPVSTTKYAIYNGVGETDAQGTKYGFYVDGELVEFYATTALSLTKGDVVSYTLTNGKISAAEKKTALASAKTVSLVDTTFVVAGGNVYYFAKTGVKVFDAVTKAAVELTAGATATLYGKDANNVEFIVVG